MNKRLNTENSKHIMVANLCLALSACGLGDISTGFGFDYEVPDSPWCSNLQTGQTQHVILGGQCPAGWMDGSINECTNITSGEVELKLMQYPKQCPDGYIGGEIHDECGDGKTFELESNPCL